jgi:glycosyltransferase involved in cell wall biosynthesis
MIHACTIVARNYLAQATVLVNSFRRHHPDGTFVVLLVDEVTAGRPLIPGAEVLLIDEIQVRRHELDRMTVAYDLLELATALKPWLMRFLLGRGCDHVAYFDPDISIERRIEELPGWARERSVVLTPHLTEPMPRDGRLPHEQTILLSGTYNLGFIAVGDTADGRRMLDWWATRLLTDARVDVAHGFFTDQRLVDLVPGLFEHVVVTDPSWNVAYWNLATRRLERGRDGEVRVNGRRLTFQHFSGYSPADPHLLSRFQGVDPRVLLSELPVLRELCDDYGRRLREASYDEHQRDFQTPFHTHDGIPVTPTVRRLVRDDRWEPSGQSLAGWLLSAGPGDVGGLGRLLAAVYEKRPDLQDAFPQVRRGDVRRFLDWAERFGGHEEGIPQSLVAQVRARSSAGPALPLSRRPDPVRATRPVHGVELAGYLTADLGLGETARQFAASLEGAGIALSTTTYQATRSVLGTPWRDRLPADGTRHDTLLMCINADMTGAFQQQAGRRYLRGRYRIGLWFWELDELPDTMAPALDLVDEVWTCSHYYATGIRSRTRKPVIVLPHPVRVPASQPVQTPEVPVDGTFTFLFVFDHFSVFQRKNPLGVIAAFKQAFPRTGEARLVIKSVNAAAFPRDREQLRYAADRPDIVLIERNVDRIELDGLMGACDAYVSLHRSEGFGQTVGEMMALGKPVISTGYSGSLEFTSPDNSFLVDVDLTPVPPGCDPYPAGATWAEPRRDHAAALMRRVVDEPEAGRARGARAAADIGRRFSQPSLGRAARSRLETIWESPRHALRRDRLPSARA